MRFAFLIVISGLFSVNLMASEEAFFCYQNEDQEVKVFDLTYDPVNEKRVGHLYHQKLGDIQQVENSIYTDDFFLEPDHGNTFHLSLGERQMKVYCVGEYKKVDRLEEQEKFMIGFANLNFRQFYGLGTKGIPL